MDKHIFGVKAIALAVAAAFLPGQGALAADQSEDKHLGEMVVKSDKSALPANVPASTESVTAKQIAESVNSVSSSGALMYLPSVHVRERFILKTSVTPPGLHDRSANEGVPVARWPRWCA